MHHVLREQADAAARDAVADRLGVEAGVDRVERVGAVLVEMERAGPERVLEAAWHAAGPFGRLGLALDHLPGRGPGRPF